VATPIRPHKEHQRRVSRHCPDGSFQQPSLV
jgi:hypothetical protein